MNTNKFYLNPFIKIQIQNPHGKEVGNFMHGCNTDIFIYAATPKLCRRCLWSVVQAIN